MSNTNGYQTLTKSMNGIITLSDGSGTTISDGTITVNNMTSQNIVANNAGQPSSIYANSTDDIYIGTNCNRLYFKNMYTQQFLGSEYFEDSYPTLPFNFLTNNSSTITLGNSTTPLIGAYTCTAPTHLANKAYVDTYGVSLGTANVWTALNTFTWPYVKLKGIDNISSTVMEIFPSLSNASGYLVLGSTSWASLTLNYLGSTLQSIGSLIVKSYGLLDMASGTSSYFKLTGGSGASTITSTGSIESTASTSNTITATSATNVGINNALTSKTSILRCQSTTSSQLGSNTEVIIDAPSVEIGQPTGSNVLYGQNTIGTSTSNQNIVGDTTSFQGITEIQNLAPVTWFNNVDNTQRMDINPNTTGKVSILFKTYAANQSVVTSSITATAGTATAGSGNLVIDANKLALNTITDGTMDFITSATGMTNLTYTNGASTANYYQFGDDYMHVAIGGGSTYAIAFNTQGLPNHSFLLIGNASNGPATFTLPSTAQRSGFRFYIYNHSAHTMTISTTGNRFTGPGLARAGQASFTMASNTGRMITSFSSSSTAQFLSGLNTNMVVFTL